MYALGSDWRHWVCAIGTSSRHVNLRFLYGVLLDDPLHVLRPGSSVLMTWDFTPGETIDAEAVGSYVNKAVGRYPDYRANSAEIQDKARTRAAEREKPEAERLSGGLVRPLPCEPLSRASFLPAPLPPCVSACAISCGARNGDRTATPDRAERYSRRFRACGEGIRPSDTSAGPSHGVGHRAATASGAVTFVGRKPPRRRRLQGHRVRDGPVSRPRATGAPSPPAGRRQGLRMGPKDRTRAVRPRGRGRTPRAGPRSRSCPSSASPPWRAPLAPGRDRRASPRVHAG